VVDRYATFLVEKFGDRISVRLWDATKAECAEKGIQWLSNMALKRCLGHYAECKLAPDGVRRRASALTKQLSKPGLLDPWQIPPNQTCPYCFNLEGAVVAILDENEAADD
jgi:hypothetical protein